MKTIQAAVCGNHHSRGWRIRGPVVSAAGLASFNSRKRDLPMLLFCFESEIFLGGWRWCSSGRLTAARSERIYSQTERQRACLPCISPRLKSPITFKGKTNIKLLFVTHFQCVSLPFLSVGIRSIALLHYWCRQGRNRKSPKATNYFNCDPLWFPPNCFCEA